MKYKLVVPFHWYSGEAYTPPPYLKRYFDALKEAEKWKRRCDKVYESNIDILSKESLQSFQKQVKGFFGLQVDGYIDGPARIYEVSEKQIK